MLFLSISILAISSYAAADATSSDAPSQTTYTRHPMTRVMCSQQPKQTCYGFALDPSAEVDGVCGWSPSENKCAVVSIGEEPKEGTMCMMHRTLAACINGHPSGMGKQGAGMGMCINGHPSGMGKQGA